MEFIQYAKEIAATPAMNTANHRAMLRLILLLLQHLP
jgi:hypothetical protein